jgi:hypothetical protein
MKSYSFTAACLIALTPLMMTNLLDAAPKGGGARMGASRPAPSHVGKAHASPARTGNIHPGAAPARPNQATTTHPGVAHANAAKMGHPQPNGNKNMQANGGKNGLQMNGGKNMQANGGKNGMQTNTGKNGGARSNGKSLPRGYRGFSNADALSTGPSVDGTSMKPTPRNAYDILADHVSSAHAGSEGSPR